ncbi:GNAT family N-acetyltransferase [Pseudoruegeria sp. SHC-113]|uniref:GNAT family N-acetyltransferase n=1 Tax=Pseudoruegeria sp. SHC-113 TaxID=2855439 RepID=UPI0021BB4933|nr:N-acetyltransferase [Pseudoruegeria sp. SHC-113]MCT8159645.1 N-acetyltransferase [Pseudoruegeria sp. SHC-113]
MEIRATTPDDYAAIDDVIIEAFGQVDEARLVDMLRRDRAVALELVAEVTRPNGPEIVGHILFSRFAEPAGWLALAPVSVKPSRHRQGIGGKLIASGCAAAQEAGYAAVVVLGSPKLYGRHGFSVKQAAGLTSPYPLEYTGLRWLGEGSGTPEARLRYPDAFARLEN